MRSLFAFVASEKNDSDDVVGRGWGEQKRAGRIFRKYSQLGNTHNFPVNELCFKRAKRGAIILRGRPTAWQHISAEFLTNLIHMRKLFYYIGTSYQAKKPSSSSKQGSTRDVSCRRASWASFLNCTERAHSLLRLNCSENIKR